MKACGCCRVDLGSRLKISLATLLLWGGLVLSGCAVAAKQEVWLIPEGYVGWVRVDYALQGERPLPEENGRYIVRVPQSGHLRTSSINRPSIDRNEYYSENSNGRHALSFSRHSSNYGIQNAFGGGFLNISHGRRIWFWQQPQITFECVFVGTASDLKADRRDCSAWRADASEPPKLGRRN